MATKKIGKRSIYFDRTGKCIERTVYIASDGSRYIKYRGYIVHVKQTYGSGYVTTDF